MQPSQQTKKIPLEHALDKFTDIIEKLIPNMPKDIKHTWGQKLLDLDLLLYELLYIAKDFPEQRHTALRQLKNKFFLIQTILQTLQSWLWKVLKVKLHPNKIYLQHHTKGVAFVGAVIKPNRTYINNRTVGNCITLIKQYNKLTDEEIENDIERFAQRYNAYLGFMIHHKSYAIRYKLWNMIDNKIKKYIYITNSMQTLKVRNKYKYKNKLLKQYGNKSNYRKRRICYKKTNVWHVDRSRKTQ